MSHAVPLMPGATGRRPSGAPFDGLLLTVAVTLLGLGLVMIASASLGIAERQSGDPFYYLIRQGLYAVLGLVLARQAAKVPLATWQEISPLLLLGSILLLALVLVPGIGRTVNGSTRWISLGIFNLQVSEIAKLSLVLYIAGYLVRRGDAVRNSIGGFVRPMLPVGVLVFLCLGEPDFGASAVMLATALGMLFLGGVRLWLFGLLLGAALGAMAVLAVSESYRVQRLTAFLNPWADPYNTGFQLTQALIAFGRGDWLGVGLGDSVQKLFYLPEAHTDFVFAVLGEELGFVGVVGVVLLYGVLALRIFAVGRRAYTADCGFGAYLCYGVALWLGMQAVINMGVNMGVLPTKGLTLPLMSYGGSSMLVTCVAIALVLRVDYELRRGRRGGREV